MSQKFAEILLPTALNDSFTYLYQGELEIGHIAKVEFGKRKMWGLVVKIDLEKPENLEIEKIKKILATKDNIFIKPSYVDFIYKLSDYNLASKGLVLKAFIGILNSDKTKKDITPLQQNFDKNNLQLKNLLPDQQEIADKIWQKIKQKPQQNFLLDGVTGSGKTEIYFDLIAKILSQNTKSQSLILLPEIALTSQILMRFKEQFGFEAAIWHSKITLKDKREIFYGLNSGSLRVLIGARSALLLPFSNLRLIVIDEEHDSSFKQEDIFKFHARDMAILLANIKKIPTILTSATPSVETYANAINNKYQHFILKKSFGSKNDIQIVDLRQDKLENQKFICSILRQEIAKKLLEKKQILLFINRRGHSPVTICKKCGQKYQCLNCDSNLVLHKHKNQLICHYCSHQEQKKDICKFCNEEDSLVSLGVGVEKILEEVNEIFPQSRTALATSDVITNFKKADDLVQKILANEVDIIIGTQMIAKGYDFPNLALVGIVDVDSMLYSSELRSLERVFQILQQVIGRSGRRKEKGKVIIQTFNPKSLIFQFIQSDNKKDFYDFELENRKIGEFPPFGRMAKIEISAFKEFEAKNFAKYIIQKFPISDKIEIFGPTPAAITRLKNRYQFLINIKSDKKVNLQKLIKDILQTIKTPNNIRIRIDIDPQ